MIILLNAPAILLEVLTLAKHRIATAYEFPPDWVNLQVKVAQATGVPSVEVDLFIPDDPKEFQNAKYFSESPEWRKEVLAGVVHWAKNEFAYRRKGARA